MKEGTPVVRLLQQQDLAAAVDLVTAQNSRPRHASSYVAKRRASIEKEFAAALESPGQLLAGAFVGGVLAGVMSGYVDAAKGTCDCGGPFVDEAYDYLPCAGALLDFVRAAAPGLRYNFFFDSRNSGCLALMGAAGAHSRGNEYILALDRAAFAPRPAPVCVAALPPSLHGELVRLHDTLFPGCYADGKEVVASLAGERRAFGIVERGALAGYAVLRRHGAGTTATAEFFGVAPGFRGRGYGRALVGHLAEVAFVDAETAKLELVVEADNEAALALYRSAGFTLLVENCAYRL